MDYQIVPLTIKDVSEMLLLVSKIVIEDFPDYSPKVRKIYSESYFSEKYFKKFLRCKTNIVFGVRDHDKLVAVLSAKGEYGGVLYIDLLAVAKIYRGKGIGSQLLQEVERWAFKHAYHYIWLFTESQNNIDYYKHHGFAYVGVYKGAWFGEDEHMLSKKIKDEPFSIVFTNYSKYF